MLPNTCTAPILFLLWVTFAEHKWVVLGERRRDQTHHSSIAGVSGEGNSMSQITNFARGQLAESKRP